MLPCGLYRHLELRQWLRCHALLEQVVHATGSCALRVAGLQVQYRVLRGGLSSAPTAFAAAAVASSALAAALAAASVAAAEPVAPSAVAVTAAAVAVTTAAVAPTAITATAISPSTLASAPFAPAVLPTTRMASGRRSAAPVYP